MTVTRQGKDKFNAPVEEVVDAINAVLAKGGNTYRYDQITFNNDSKSFKVMIKPSLWPLLLSTTMTILAIPGKAATTVIVETCSQRFIYGDIFNFYNRYISDLLNALRLSLSSAHDTNEEIAS